MKSTICYTATLLLLIHQRRFVQCAEEKQHLILSSFLNPLAESPDMPTLANGLYERDMTHLLFDYLDLTYEITHPPDVLASGTLAKNGSWNGCMGQLQLKEVDVCLTLSSPSKTKKDYVWMRTLASTVAMTVSFHYSYRYLPNYHQPHFIMSMSYWFLFLLSSLNGGRMGYHREDAIQSKYRWILATWFLALVVLLNAYRTVLFVILTVPHYFELVNNVDELENRTEINVHVNAP